MSNWNQTGKKIFIKSNFYSDAVSASKICQKSVQMQVNITHRIEKLPWIKILSPETNTFCHKASWFFFQLKQSLYFLPLCGLKNILLVSPSSCFNYWDATNTDLPESSITHLQIVSNAAAGMLTEGKETGSSLSLFLWSGSLFPLQFNLKPSWLSFTDVKRTIGAFLLIFSGP